MSRRLKAADRRYFVGGSDARIIMGDDEDALLRLWREKRGEIEPEDLSGNLIVQLGVVTEPLNRNPNRPALRPDHFSAHKRLFVGFDFKRSPETHSGSSPVLVDKLHAGPLQNSRDSGERFLIARVSAGFDVGDRVAMKLSGFREVPDGPV
jgi:hypothetical protein